MPPIRKYAVLIGVERSLDDGLKGPDFATADVRAMKSALERLGYPRRDILAVTGKAAAWETVEPRLHAFFERAEENPGTLFFYFAGPGFSTDGRNFLGFRDTTLDDLEGTGLELDGVIRMIRDASFSQGQVYLDCGWNVATPDEGAGLPGIFPLSEESLEPSLGDDPRLVLFSACKFHEPSYSSRSLKRGIWAHGLVEALSGQAPEVLGARGVLTAGALQSFLADRVPRALRDTYTDRRKRQTPWFMGALDHDFKIADLAPILGHSRNPLGSLSAVVKDFSFTRRERVRVKTLSGFRQGVHHSPKWSNRQAEEFVARIAVGEIDSDLAAKFETIRQNMAYRRRQIEVHPAGEGDASIRTPDFQYTVSVGLDEDPALVVITRELSDIHRPEILGDERLARTFDEAFDSVRLAFDRTIEIEDLIDLAEAHGLPVTYPPDCSHCTIRAADGAVIRVAGTHLDLKYAHGQSLGRLAQGLDQILHLFPSRGALPAPSSRRG